MLGRCTSMYLHAQDLALNAIPCESVAIDCYSARNMISINRKHNRLHSCAPSVHVPPVATSCSLQLCFLVLFEPFVSSPHDLTDLEYPSRLRCGFTTFRGTLHRPQSAIPNGPFVAVSVSRFELGSYRLSVGSSTRRLNYLSQNIGGPSEICPISERVGPGKIPVARLLYQNSANDSVSMTIILILSSAQSCHTMTRIVLHDHIQYIFNVVCFPHFLD